MYMQVNVSMYTHSHTYIRKNYYYLELNLLILTTILTLAIYSVLDKLASNRAINDP